MEHFSIELTNLRNYYFSGDAIEGKVIVKTEKPLVVKGITLVVEGSGRAQLSLTETFTVYDENHDNSKKKVLAKYNRAAIDAKEEKYIFEKLYLVHTTQDTVTLPEGTSTYPFKFVLPANCPSTFHTNFGYVAYFLEAEVQRTVESRNLKTKMAFTVNGILDLNTSPGAEQPQQMQKSKLPNKLAFRSGHLNFILKLPKSGYVPGENLDFSCDITNKSNRSINGVKASLQQALYFQNRIKTVEKRRVFCLVEGSNVKPGEHFLWKPQNNEIPALRPTGLGGKCKVIDVLYFLRFEANISGLSKSLVGELPVIIGTKPLKNGLENGED